jgi:hypothetical protein
LEATTLQWVKDRFREAGLNPDIRSYYEHHEWVERDRYLGSQPDLVADQRWVTGEIGDRNWPTKVVVGIGVDVDLTGEFWVTAHAAWGDLQTTATRQWVREDATAPIESIEVNAIIEAVDTDVKSVCRDILRELIEAGT